MTTATAPTAGRTCTIALDADTVCGAPAVEAYAVTAVCAAHTDTPEVALDDRARTVLPAGTVLDVPVIRYGVVDRYRTEILTADEVVRVTYATTDGGLAVERPMLRGARATALNVTARYAGVALTPADSLTGVSCGGRVTIAAGRVTSTDAAGRLPVEQRAARRGLTLAELRAELLGILDAGEQYGRSIDERPGDGRPAPRAALVREAAELAELLDRWPSVTAR